MFERFTDRARRVVVLAQEEARLLNHNYIGTEHVLLGLIHEREGIAAKALESLGVGLDSVRTEVVEIIGRGEQSPAGHIPFTPRASKVFELSLRESLELGHNHIDTEHILLGLLRQGDGVAAHVLAKLGVNRAQLRQMVFELTGGSSTAEPYSEEGWPQEGWPPEEKVLRQSPAPGWMRESSGFGPVVRDFRTSLGIVALLSILFVLVTIVALLVNRPLTGLASAGLVLLAGGIVVSTVGAVAHLRASGRSLDGGVRVARWSAVAALMLFATASLLFILDPFLH